MPSIPLEQAQAQLADLVAHLSPGEEWLITQQDEPVARLTSAHAKTRSPRIPGSAIGKLKVLVEDDEHLQDFKDYMP
jgi:antitoxin (DNA-binding transcriptional repressor) of toxin-antitoxin stability system